MKHIWSVLCRHGSVETGVNVMTLQDVMEEVTLTFPGDVPPPTGNQNLPISMELITLIHREEGEKEGHAGRFRIVLKTPLDPQPDQQYPFDLVFTDAPGMRCIVKIAAVLWRGTGTYWFHVQFPAGKGWKTVAELPLRLKLSEESSSAEQAGGARSAKKRTTRKGRKRRS